MQELHQQKQRHSAKQSKRQTNRKVTNQQILTFESVRRLGAHCFVEREGRMVEQDTEIKEIVGNLDTYQKLTLSKMSLYHLQNCLFIINSPHISFSFGWNSFPVQPTYSIFPLPSHPCSLTPVHSLYFCSPTITFPSLNHSFYFSTFLLST